jgi:hypothetical protein
MGTKVPSQITLFFSDTVISFIGTAEQIRDKKYNLTQFGPIIGGEGENWELILKDAVIDTSPPPPCSGVLYE